MGTLRFFEEVVSFKIRRTFGFADYTGEDFGMWIDCGVAVGCRSSATADERIF